MVGALAANEQPARQSHGQESQTSDSQLSEAESWRKLYTQTLKTGIQVRVLPFISN